MIRLILLACCLTPLGVYLIQPVTPAVPGHFFPIQGDTSTYYKRSGCVQLSFVAFQGNSAAELAERDLQANKPFLILASGLGPVTFTTDAAFEKQFNVQYYEQGCVSPSQALMMAYNHRIFDYLYATYGKAWRRTVRPDVVGLKQWKPKP